MEGEHKNNGMGEGKEKGIRSERGGKEERKGEEAQRGRRGMERDFLKCGGLGE